jgi:ATPase subunit of ABC transporter with duplicated ATPase domains
VAHPYLKAQSLTHHYGGETLFRGVDLVLNPGDRVGLVGPNGVGKTTLLAILAGQLKPVAGQVTRAPGTRIGWSAELLTDTSATVGSYLAAGLGEVGLLTARMRALESAMAGADQALLAEYAAVQERWTALRGWTMSSRLDAVRDHLDLGHLADAIGLDQVSGGEQARLTLARLLLADPDVLVLDEPTNHLDADGAAWLGGYLARFGGAVLAVSHDRGFLDRAVTRIAELDGIHLELQCYQGGYTEYRAEKACRWQRLLRSYEAQEKYRRRLEADIDAVKGYALATEESTTNDRLRRYAKKVAKKAKTRERRLERQMQAVRWIAEPQARPPLVLAFPGSGTEHGSQTVTQPLPGETRRRPWPSENEAGPGENRSGPDGTRAGPGQNGPGPAAGTVLAARGLTVTLGDRRLLDGVVLRLCAGDRVLVSGPNGAGKTTLVRALAGRLEPDSGQVDAVHQPGVLAQDNGGLPAAVSVLDYFRSAVAVYADDAERLLDGYLFGPDQWKVSLRTLSAGELRRLQLAVLVNCGSPVLLLDEPTNYLDFDALDVVEEALRAYRGTLVMVTHDAYFADRVGCTRHWQVSAGGVSEVRLRPAQRAVPAQSAAGNAVVQAAAVAPERQAGPGELAGSAQFRCPEQPDGDRPRGPGQGRPGPGDDGERADHRRRGVAPEQAVSELSAQPLGQRHEVPGRHHPVQDAWHGAAIRSVPAGRGGQPQPQRQVVSHPQLAEIRDDAAGQRAG